MLNLNPDYNGENNINRYGLWISVFLLTQCLRKFPSNIELYLDKVINIQKEV